MATPRIYKIDGIILKRRNTGETDRIITIFTKEYGKLRLLAKGVRRVSSRRAPHLEIFSHVIMMIHKGKTMDIITEAESLDHFEELRSDLSRVSAGYYLCELVNSLTPEKQEHRNVFALLLRALRALEENKRTTVIAAFPGILVEMLGFVSKIKRHEVSNDFIERIIEKRLKTPKFLTQMS